jgi:pimeloyl-ACP methyl ester carboxylesterase
MNRLCTGKSLDMAGICMTVAVAGLLTLSGPANAQRSDRELPRLMADVAPSASRGSFAVPGCPSQGGLLNSITVPVDQPLNLRVVVSVPAPSGGAVFNVASDNPAFVAAGDRRQGFIPTVTIAAGATQSNPFTIFGISVGQTVLRITPLTAGYAPSTTPLGAWDINKSGSGSDQKFLDANAPAKLCRAATSNTISTAPAVLASCGSPVKGVATDGVSPLLLRTVSGLAGTACFEIVSTASADQGLVATPLATTSVVSSLNYGFSQFTPPKFFDGTGDNRTVDVEFSFTPNIGNGNTSRLRAQLQLVRPPVVLVHGLWSNGAAWSGDYTGSARNNSFRSVEAADYAATNASSFSINNQRVKTAAAAAIGTSRRKGWAATQVDVVGHSMGGLLTRLYADATDYKRPDNLGQGDVRRLITLDTPHWGSSFANLLVALHNGTAAEATYAEATVTGLTGGNMLQGAVCDLSENSTALAALGSTALRSQAITATGGPNGSVANPAPYWGGATVFGLNSFEEALTRTFCAQWSGRGVCARRDFHLPRATVDAYRFREGNDAVVSLTSQGGGLAGTNYPAYLHFHIPGIPGVTRGVTDGTDVAAQVFQIFDGPDSGLAAGFAAVPSDGSGTPRAPVPGITGAAAAFAAQCAPGGPMKPPGLQMKATRREAALVDPSVTIVSPAPGTLVDLGSPLAVTVTLQPPLDEFNTVVVDFRGQGRVEASWNGGRSFTAVLPSTVLAAGPLVLTPEATDTAGNTRFGAPVSVAVRALGAPTLLRLQKRNVTLVPAGATQQFYVRGTYPDGSELDLHQAASGMAWSSSNDAVVSVSPDGLVTPGNAGRASVTAQLGALSTSATVLVEDPANPLPPSSVGNAVQISASGFRLDRATGLYLQDLKLSNSSGRALAGPLYLLVRGLTPGVALVSKSGLSEAVTPVGSPYILLALPDEGLSLPAGAQLQLTLRFLNAARDRISYTTDVVVSSNVP